MSVMDFSFYSGSEVCKYVLGQDEKAWLNWLLAPISKISMLGMILTMYKIPASKEEKRRKTEERERPSLYKNHRRQISNRCSP